MVYNLICLKMAYLSDTEKNEIILIYRESGSNSIFAFVESLKIELSKLLCVCS